MTRIDDPQRATPFSALKQNPAEATGHRRGVLMMIGALLANGLLAMRVRASLAPESMKSGREGETAL